MPSAGTGTGTVTGTYGEEHVLLIEDPGNGEIERADMQQVVGHVENDGMMPLESHHSPDEKAIVSKKETE